MLFVAITRMWTVRFKISTLLLPRDFCRRYILSVLSLTAPPFFISLSQLGSSSLRLAIRLFGHHTKMKQHKQGQTGARHPGWEGTEWSDGTHRLPRWTHQNHMLSTFPATCPDLVSFIFRARRRLFSDSSSRNHIYSKSSFGIKSDNQPIRGQTGITWSWENL